MSDIDRYKPLLKALTRQDPNRSLRLCDARQRARTWRCEGYSEGYSRGAGVAEVKNTCHKRGRASGSPKPARPKCSANLRIAPHDFTI